MMLRDIRTAGPDPEIADDGALIDGDDWIRFDRLVAEQERERYCDARHRALLSAYGQEAATLARQETLLRLGMSGRVARLQILERGREGFRGQRFAFVRCPDGLAILQRPLSARGLGRVLVQPALIGRPSHFLVTGSIDGDPAHLALSALPLRPQQGQIREILLAVTCKLENIPPRLRQEFFARHF